MGVIFELDEYVVLKDFYFKTALFPNKDPQQKTILFRAGEVINGFPMGNTIMVDTEDGYKVYVPIEFIRTYLNPTGRKVRPHEPTSSANGLNSWFERQ